jgi:hypothetical protein
MLPLPVIRLPSSDIATKMRELNGGKFERDRPATMRLATMATRIKTSGSPIMPAGESIFIIYQFGVNARYYRKLI